MAIRKAARCIGRTARVAVFGVTRPGQWFRNYFRSGATLIEPSEADARALGPADPPELVVTDQPGPRAMHAEDEHRNAKRLGRRRERGE